MSKKKDNKKGNKGKGGFGKFLVVAVVVIVGGGAAAWFLAPDQVQAQLDSLKSMLGM